MSDVCWKHNGQGEERAISFPITGTSLEAGSELCAAGQTYIIAGVYNSVYAFLDCSEADKCEAFLQSADFNLDDTETAAGTKQVSVVTGASLPPPSLPSSPPPSPPDVELESNEIIAGVRTNVTVRGSFVAEGHWLVFLSAGSADCAGAARARSTQGGRVNAGRVAITLPQPGSYKVCHSALPAPTTDAHFAFLSNVILDVLSVSPPPSPPVRSNAISDEAKVAIIAGSTGGALVLLLIGLIGLVFWRRKPAHVARRTEHRVATRGLLKPAEIGMAPLQVRDIAERLVSRRGTGVDVQIRRAHEGLEPTEENIESA